jgi:hypothetical protein
MSDFKAGQRIELQYSKDEYLLLSNNNLVNLRNGTSHKHISNAFWDIQTVSSAENKLLAVRQAYDLVYYNPIVHDKAIAQMKRLNNLFSFNEMAYRLAEMKIFINWKIVHYEKIKTTKMRVGLQHNNFVTYQAQIELKEHNKQCVITRIEIYKENHIYLYHYDLLENMYSLL